MLNFTYSNPTRIHFGKGQIAQLTTELPKTAKVMVLYGGGSIKKNGVYDQVMKALEGRSIVEFSGIEPNPTYETAMDAVKLAREEKVDFLLAVGGGSVIDGVKFISAAIPFDGEPWDILEKSAPVTTALPIGVVLTLPATGSESNGGSVMSRKKTQDKLAFMSPKVHPLFAILDPEVTYTLPERQITNGIVDAFVHIMEQYLTYDVDAKVQDRFSEGLLLTLIEEGPRVFEQPDDYDIRANIMWTATLALNGLIGSGVPQDWATHMIGHELTALYGLDHAQTLAIVLPRLMWNQRAQKEGKLLQYAERVWGLTEGSSDERIQQAIAKTEDFFHRVKMPTKLSDYNLDQNVADQVAAQLERHGMTKLGEAGTVTITAAKDILTAAA